MFADTSHVLPRLCTTFCAAITAIGLSLLATSAAAATPSEANAAINILGTGGDPSKGPFAEGYDIYRINCGTCHDAGDARTPQMMLLRDMTPEAINIALTQGVMRVQGEALSAGEKIAVSEFITGRKMVAGGNDESLRMCDEGHDGFDFDAPSPFANWGLDAKGTHFIPTEVAGLDRGNVGKLKLKWAYAFPNSQRMRSQPAIAGGAIILGNHSGAVRALDLETGCTRWNFDAEAEVRTGIVISPWRAGDSNARPLAYFGDVRGNVYAVEAATGRQVWKIAADNHPAALITGTPALHKGILYVPVSSIEEATAAAPGYICCTFRGSVLAVNAHTGKQKWRTYMVGKPVPTAAEESMWGPSGVAVWNSPAIDAKRNQLYVATGDNYSNPPTKLSDAIVALDLKSGRIKWHHQALAGDAWNVDCFTKINGNCPEGEGPDFDFGAGTVLTQDKNGREVLLAGQKSGITYGLDPRNGKPLWQTRVGRGGPAGGTVFGIAAANGTVFVPVFDKVSVQESAFPASPGIHALDIASGKRLWSMLLKEDTCAGKPACVTGIAGAISVTPELVLAGADDGHIRILDTANGQVLWQKDTTGSHDTINGVPGHGGAISGGAAPIAYRGNLIAVSGYGFAGRMTGNMLFVFAAD